MGNALSPAAARIWKPPVSPRFNLVDEEWIPVVLDSGGSREIGIRDLLSQSRQIESVSGDSVLVEVAVIRLLVAILCHAHQGPRDEASWQALWDAPSLLDETLEGYLSNHHAGFFLLDPDRPFGQSTKAGMTGKSNIEPSLSALSHYCASGTGKRLFDKSLDEVSPCYSPSEAARTMVTYQCWAPAGGSGYGSSRLVGRALVCVPTGANLHESILLNTSRYDQAKGEPIPAHNSDQPSWTREGKDDVLAQERPIDGLVDLFTRRPRAVRLLEDESGRLGRAWIQAGERIPATSNVRDPQLLYHTAKGVPEAQPFPIEAPAWTELPGLLAARTSGNGFHCAVVSWAAHMNVNLNVMSWKAVAVDTDKASTRFVATAELRIGSRIADDPARLRAITALVKAAQGVAEALQGYFKDLGRNGPRGDRKATDKAHKAARETAASAGRVAFWSAASSAFIQALATLATGRITPDDAAAANDAWANALRGGIKAAIQRSQHLTGTSILDLIDEGRAHGELMKRLRYAIGVPIESTNSDEGG